MANPALEAEIARQAQELKNAPVVTPLCAIMVRCGLCGQMCDSNDLQPFDTHIIGGPERKAGSCCHPHRAASGKIAPPVSKPPEKKPHG